MRKSDDEFIASLSPVLRRKIAKHWLAENKFVAAERDLMLAIGSSPENLRTRLCVYNQYEDVYHQGVAPLVEVVAA